MSVTRTSLLILAMGCADVPPPPQSADVAKLQHGHLECEQPSCPDGVCPPGALWGFADLHVHPATHFAMGADHEGRNGPFYGSPGLALDDHTIDKDLGACDGDKHADSSDAILDTSRTIAYSSLEGSGHGNHLPSGSPTFETWPSARSPTHQQMHVEWLKRAYDGGLRLMVASVTDNQLFETFWTRQTGLRLEDDLDPSGAAGRDYDSAVRQLKFIHDLAAANPDWLAIVRTADEAACALQQGKLAMVLALEMDSLTVEQMITLRDELDVTVVTPIHLRDHPELGGMAASVDLFNASSYAMGGSHVAVYDDPDLRHRYATPVHVNDFPAIIPYFGAQISVMDHPDDTCDQGYEVCSASEVVEPSGHANKLGLRPGADDLITKLMSAGLIVDLAHMSDLAQEEVLGLAAAKGMPVIDSHTDLRGWPFEGHHDPRTLSERMLKDSHLASIAWLRGMVGLGTVGDLDLSPVVSAEGNVLMRLGTDKGLPTEGTVVANQPRLRLSIHSGADGLRDSSSVEWEVAGADGVFEEWRDGELRELGTLEDKGLEFVDLVLPAGTRPDDLPALTLTLVQGSCGACNSDNWDLEGLDVTWLGPDETVQLFTGRGEVYRFTESAPVLDLPLVPNRSLDVLQFEVWTGDDGLDCDASATLTMAFADGSTWVDHTGEELTLSPRDGLPANSWFVRPVALPADQSVYDITGIGITHHQGGGCIDADNWNLERLEIHRSLETHDEVFFERDGWPIYRFSETHPELALPVELTIDEPAHRGRLLWVTVKTGADDLKAGAKATLTLKIDDVEVETPLNEGTLWRQNTTHKVLVDLGSEMDLTALKAATIEVAWPRGWDEWRIRSLEIEAIGTPMRHWWSDYEYATSMLGAGGVAFGSDLNGLEMQLNASEVVPDYPLRPLGDPKEASLPVQELGDRTTDFRTEGLSNIGQLPDWIGAAEALDPEPGDTEPIYSSAQYFVQMWYHAEQAAGAM